MESLATWCHPHSSSLMQFSISFHRFWFSIAAAILSLSLICLLISSSVLWVPFLMKMSSFRLCGKWRRILILMVSPIRVAKEQCGTVGLNSTLTTGTSPSACFVTKTQSSLTTFRSCVERRNKLNFQNKQILIARTSSVFGFSGSLIVRKRS